MTDNTKDITAMNTDKEKLKYTPQEVFEWFQTKKFQREQGHQEYQMIYEIDLPRIINQFISDKNLSVCDERIKQLEE